MAGYAIRGHRIKDKYVEHSKEISISRPVNMIEKPTNVNVLSTTTASVTPMRNCTQSVGKEGPDKLTEGLFVLLISCLYE